jgi:hypothetical protein
MGDYIYALRSPKLMRKVLVKRTKTGIFEELTVASMSYLFKPYSDWSGYGRDKNERYWQVIDRLAKLWGEQEPPLYAAMTYHSGHKIKVGDSVHGFRNRQKEQIIVPWSYNDGAELWFEVGCIVELL